MCVCERGRKREIERQREKNSKVHKFPGKMSYISYLSLCLIFSLSMRPSHSISCVNICIENQFVNSFFFFSSNEMFCSKSWIYQYSKSESTNNMNAHKMCKSLAAKERYVSTSDTSFWLSHSYNAHTHTRTNAHALFDSFSSFVIIGHFMSIFYDQIN